MAFGGLTRGAVLTAGRVFRAVAARTVSWLLLTFGTVLVRFVTAGIVSVRTAGMGCDSTTDGGTISGWGSPARLLAPVSADVHPDHHMAARMRAPRINMVLAFMSSEFERTRVRQTGLIYQKKRDIQGLLSGRRKRTRMYVHESCEFTRP